ncbi:MAG: peptidyl-prolyl cis-trans isomerase [Opitutaceae bacterium]|jgi:peptidyl-prolyl cis-trans isomerase D
MISWIQRTFQQHFKWLFLLLLVTVIVSFIFITNTSSGLGQASRHVPPRPFFGINLGSAEDSQLLVKDATLSVQLHGLQIRNESQFQQYALQRLAAIHLAGELNLPEPTNDDLIAHVQTLRAFAGPDGQFDPKRYAEFRDSLKTNPQIHESDVSRVISDDVTYQQVLKLLSGPGYVLPADVQNQLNRIDATWTLEAVTIDYAGFKPAITVTDEALSKYFEYNASRYEIAAKVGVSYIDFPSSAYVGQVTASEEGLRAYFDANRTRFPLPATDKTATPLSDDATFAAVHAQVEAAYKLERAKAVAATAASDVAVALFDAKVTAATLEAFLSARNLQLKPVAAFNADSVPAELGGNRRVATAALKTDAQHIFSDPVDTGRGSAILVWKESIAARQPGLAEVKDRVTADFLESEKHKLFAEAGRTLRTALETRIKAGDTLAQAVTASVSVIPAKLATKSWPAFTLTTPPKDLDYSVYSAIDGLQKGELSQMVSNAEQGLIVYAADKKLPTSDPTAPKYVEMRNRMATFTGSRNGSDLLADIVNAELAKSAPATP